MIFHKYKRCIHFMFCTKQLITACLKEDIHIIVTSSTLLFILFVLLKSEHLIWKHLKVILLIELCLHDVPYSPAIIATLNKNLNYKWLIVIFYTTRTATKYAMNFEILDWVYLSVQFFAIMCYLKFKKQNEKKIETKKPHYIRMGPIAESIEVFDLLNNLPCGVCLLDNSLTMVSTNSKAKNFVANQAENNIQQAVFMMIQKAYLQQPCINSFRKNDKHRSIFESIDEQGSDFVIKRLQSFCQPRRSTIQQKLNISNISDIAQIINKHKIKSIEEIKINSLKYKDLTSGETYEFKIFEITTGFMIVMENITNYENQQDMQERYRFYSKLINSFSHELRTPLNCSLQLLQILEQNLQDDLNVKYLKPAIISNKKLLHQINDILDYANFESQMFQLRPQLFKLSTITQTIEDYFRAECEQKQIKLYIKSCDDTWINNDYDRIMQIIVNLMNNSVKYTKQFGEIHLMIQRAGSVYQFEVFDTGCGIQIEKLYLITKILKNCELEWSQRGEEDYMQYVGLGLKVSSQIARKLCESGELSIFSSINQFTKSKFYVKDMKRYEDSYVASTEDHIQQPYKSIGRLKCQCVNVLICDDIPFNHMALSTVLTFFKVESESAYDGKMAIDMVKQKITQCKCGYKLIFMDIDMPDMDGCQATKEILHITGQYGIKCNVIMCSAFDSKENIDYAIKSGMREILPKPVDTNLLKKILQKYYF